MKRRPLPPDAVKIPASDTDRLLRIEIAARAFVAVLEDAEGDELEDLREALGMPRSHG